MSDFEGLKLGYKVDVEVLEEIDVDALKELSPAPPAGPPPSLEGAALGMEADVESGTCDGVDDSEDPPFSAVALLRINMPNGPDLRGTGFFISPGFLLTAGHNVLVDGTDKPTSIDVMTAFNGHSVMQGFRCKTFAPAPEYEQNPVPGNDYGMIFVGRDLDVGNFGALPASSAELSGLPVELISYPSDNLRQADCTGVVHDVDSDTLLYNIPTRGGSSGGPVFLSKGDPRAVAIHVKGPFGNLNMGTRLTPRKIAQIKKWLDDGP